MYTYVYTIRFLMQILKFIHVFDIYVYVYMYIYLCYICVYIYAFLQG